MSRNKTAALSSFPLLCIAALGRPEHYAILHSRRHSSPQHPAPLLGFHWFIQHWASCFQLTQTGRTKSLQRQPAWLHIWPWEIAIEWCKELSVPSSETKVCLWRTLRTSTSESKTSTGYPIRTQFSFCCSKRTVGVRIERSVFKKQLELANNSFEIKEFYRAIWLHIWIITFSKLFF